jgi:hypothetical protein
MSQTVREICTDALIEIQILAPGEAMPADTSSFVLGRFQRQLDAWQANRLTMAVQERTTFTITSGTSTVTIGATGADVTLTRPTWIDQLTFVVPASSPAVESQPLGAMTSDQYAALPIKTLSSSLPTQYYYNQIDNSANGELFIWPVVNQSVLMALYTPVAVGVPASMAATLVGPAGYAEAFMYQLAKRLCTPFNRSPEIRAAVTDMADTSWRTMIRPNVEPSMLDVDAALVGRGAGYNVYTDQGG